jgi:hypothetical protein
MRRRNTYALCLCFSICHSLFPLLYLTLIKLTFGVVERTRRMIEVLEEARTDSPKVIDARRVALERDDSAEVTDRPGAFADRLHAGLIDHSFRERLKLNRLPSYNSFLRRVLRLRDGEMSDRESSPKGIQVLLPMGLTVSSRTRSSRRRDQCRSQAPDR